MTNKIHPTIITIEPHQGFHHTNEYPIRYVKKRAVGLVQSPRDYITSKIAVIPY